MLERPVAGHTQKLTRRSGRLCSHTQLFSKAWPYSLGQASLLEAMMECEIVGQKPMSREVRIVDGRKDPDKSTNKPPPRRYAVAVKPYRCPKCGHEQFRRF
jgi:hypothetical protein